MVWLHQFGKLCALVQVLLFLYLLGSLLLLLLQVAVYQRKVRNKYLRLGATSVDFVDYYSPTKEVAAHAVIIGTARSVFLVFRYVVKTVTLDSVNK